MQRIGVIGTGSIAAVHLDGWRRMPGIELVGYYDIVPEAADRAAQRYGGRVFATLDELFDAVDMVDICSPGTAHKENVLAAAAAGKAIICEKPLARHLADAVEMVETCERLGVPLFPAQVVRFFPMYSRVKERIDAVARSVAEETGITVEYLTGTMIELPRAAIRAHVIAESAEFFSFGTNDLTQMTYGLSRDDAGRFMGDYVNQGVFPEDPFHVLDEDGVGELLLIGSARGRQTRHDVTLSICGEHGGNPASIAFCRRSGFDYVSCSPFRVPVARLAAAHFALTDPVSEKKAK